MIRVIEVLALGLALVGCQTAGGNAPTQTLPPDYRQQIVAKAKEVFFDPYSIRDAGIATEPYPGFGILGPNLIVCVRANAKNRMGGYTGLKPSYFVFTNGRITAAMDADEFSCFRRTYEPFPELDGGGAAAPAARR